MQGLAPGSVIGRDFEVVTHLASGAMGSVYIVLQRSTGKQRAMKLMSMELAGNDKARERFVLEARVGAKIESDHVVEVVTAGIDEGSGSPYLVMELLKGEELADMAHRSGPMPLPHVAEILKQAGHALGKAHQHGIVHRDIKPENLFIAESRREGVPFTVKILDFGIAKLVAERTNDGTQPVGTPLFMAPEQTDRRGLIAPTTDVWPLGLMAFFLLTGRHYWQGAESGITQLLREVVMEPLEPASHRATRYGMQQALPAGFDEWFSRCVNRDPGQRFPEAGSAVRAFLQIAGGNVATGPLPNATAPPATVAMPPNLQTGPGATGPNMPTGPQPWTATGGAAAQTGAQTPGQTGGSTGLTAASSMPVATQPAKSKAPLAIGAVVVVVGVGSAVYFATQSGDPAETTAATGATTAAETNAPPEGPKTCPDGMIKIDGGNMFMGSTDEDLPPDVRPPHRVKVSTFCLDKYEVTVEQYTACIKSGNCLKAITTVSFPKATPEQVTAYSPLCNFGKADKSKHPMNCVTWKEAKNFCEHDGGRLKAGGARLPSEAEWEFAARGSGQRTYPWGDEDPSPARLNACGDECNAWLTSVSLKNTPQMYDADDGFAATAPVGSFEAGASDKGIMDLAGNVWEWTADWYGEYSDGDQNDPTGASSGTERVARGGGFNGQYPAWAKPAFRWRTDPEARSQGVGFRCALPFAD